MTAVAGGAIQWIAVGLAPGGAMRIGQTRTKRPGSFRSPGLCAQSLEGCAYALASPGCHRSSFWRTHSGRFNVASRGACESPPPPAKAIATTRTNAHEPVVVRELVFDRRRFTMCP
jgi:hypothetical protein